MSFFRTSLRVAALALPALISLAQSVPTTINYQGRLTDNSPTPIPINATAQMQFSIWNDPAAGAMLWQEPADPATTPVVVTGGIFSVLLGGNGVVIPATVFSGGTTRYLQITVNGEALTPRQTISATGYANQAQNAAIAANATTADTAANSNQLGGVVASGYQLATVQNCAGQSFLKTIANGSATCAIPPANNLSAPVTLGGSLATAVLSSSNSSNGSGISASSTSGTGIIVNAGGTGITVTAGGSDGVIATSTAAGGNGIHGIANNTTSSYGVWGQSSAGSGVVGNGSASGVWGASSSLTGVGVKAQGAGPTGTALEIQGGAIRVTGAGLGTSTAAFIHVTTAGNISGWYTVITNPMTDGDPNAILIITQNSGIASNIHQVVVAYNNPNWTISNINGSAMPIGARFNVLVIKP